MSSSGVTDLVPKKNKTCGICGSAALERDVAAIAVALARRVLIFLAAHAPGAAGGPFHP